MTKNSKSGNIEELMSQFARRAPLIHTLTLKKCPQILKELKKI